MEDKPVQSFVGGRSSKDNLYLIPISRWKSISLPDELNKEALFEDLNGILDDRYYEVIWKMIAGRMEYVRSIRDSRCIDER